MSNLDYLLLVCYRQSFPPPHRDCEAILHVSRDVTDIVDILPVEPMHLVSAFIQSN